MKKRWVAILVCLGLCIASAGCSGNGENSAGTAEPTAVDVDLTALSSTMVFAEVYNMLSNPQEYMGKTVKMTGAFAIYQPVDENGQTGKTYFACIIADATACCSQGMEFVLEGDHTYPEDYPELGSEITVTGEFQTYEEDGNVYAHLINARMEEG